MLQLLVLDLSRNRLQRFDAYSALPSHLKSLKSLDLSDNEVRSVQELEHFQGMASVTSISLKGNPCEKQSRDFVSYASSVRKYFPNLEVLVRSGCGTIGWGTGVCKLLGSCKMQKLCTAKEKFNKFVYWS